MPPLRIFRSVSHIITATVFFISLAILIYSIVETSRLRIELAGRDRLLAKTIADRKSQDREMVSMKNEIGQLRAQKALYTATIETLAKKD